MRINKSVAWQRAIRRGLHQLAIKQRARGCNDSVLPTVVKSRRTTDRTTVPAASATTIAAARCALKIAQGEIPLETEAGFGRDDLAGARGVSFHFRSETRL